MSLSVKLDAAILQLGLTPGAVEYDHDPALELRARDEKTGVYSPDANDPKYIVLRTSPDHDHKTFKNNGTGRGDLTAIAHVRRIIKKDDQHIAVMEAKRTGQPAPQRKRLHKIPQRKSPWSSGRKLPSRPFEKRGRG